MIGVTGQSRPTGVQGDDGEFSSDVEWAHAIAPDAKIVLIECVPGSTEGDDLVALSNALQTAKTQGASVVSMSFGFPEVSAESPTIQSNPTLDQALFPAGLTYVTSTGDKGAPGGYPAYSSDALAIGGTQLAINPDGSYQQEAGWDNPDPAVAAILGNNGFTPYVPPVGSSFDPDNWSSITGSFSTTGTWATLSVGGSNNAYLSAAIGSNAIATWTFTNVPTYEPLEFALSWPSTGGGASQATFEVYDGTEILGSVTVNENRAPNDNTGTALGSNLFEAQGMLPPLEITSGTLKLVLDESASSKDGPVFAGPIALMDYENFGGSGGGISQYEPAPPYQNGLVISNGSSAVSSGGMRTAPDVSFDSSTYVVNVVDGSAGSFGGTSLSAPCWAGLIAIADQGLANQGIPVMDSTSTSNYAMQEALYSLPAATDFHQITSGFNGYNAGPGYNLVTGLRNPVANQA